MSRLFITPRELNFISDITKEIIKDVIGQKLYLYPISETKTNAHDVYDEAQQKVFDNPIAIDALIDNTFQTETKVNEFGIDSQYKIEAYIQWRDLVEKGIDIQIGDFFSFSDVFYEISERSFMGNIYGLPEHKDGVKLVGVKAREGQFKTRTIGPTDISRPDADAVQTTFVQQRGFAENSQGKTADVRELVRQGVLEPPLSKPHEVSERGAVADGSHVGSSFYGEEDDS